MSLLKVNQLTVMRGEDVALVDNVSLTLEAGEMLGLVGESGSGKNRDLPGADAPAAGGRTADYRR
ncbi:Oligopeptide transport ATP-binding protein OppD [Klebsiella michiganensis]|nr:Oligopeptide transport ATP-binding protein OppD [Klebsiella michiganensis]